MTRMIAAALVLTFLAPWALAGDSKGEILARMKQRFPHLIKAKSDQFIGENWAGMVSVVPSSVSGKSMSAQERQIVDAIVRGENYDRQKLYAILASETGTSPENVAARNRQRLFDKASPGHWLRDASNRWSQKR